MSHRLGHRRKNLKKGLQFTIMVVGTSGLGRTTFVNTLCAKQVLRHEQPDHTTNGVRIRPVMVDLEEEGVKINLTIVDTPGFGDSIDNESSFNDILGYVEKQYDDILAEESRIKRNPKFRDNRVHALLYFITPTGHGLRELDIELMRRLGPRVNVIPVIGKADSFTRMELIEFKRRVMEDIDHYKIPIYNFPFDDEEDDDDTIEENCELRGLLPFAIIGSEEEAATDEGNIRIRRYPWGTAEVDNSEHCDFAKLRYALLSSHLSDLKEITHDFLYENYRTEKLSRGVEDESDEEENEDEGTSQVRIKEEHLRMEEEKLREKELKVQREISEKRQELLAKEEALRSLEARLAGTQINNGH
ncbi:Septin-domain-containing protein [Thamnocephalis sphaerospora]|uniref:Septin-domain-containing protein n=1 Tax=Thamnocephalis sphaerospora TaxID=78915 RepID=A0A4P9XH77_9FUNG|nr:Septin-domain-containing protein [Thamnocephalis sphaerospora]|eukprot:RKP05025.1 Septin-domain-containing protein [Thamnocephalis sphaerospora]